MLYLNPKVSALAVPAYARPILPAGECLYVPESCVSRTALDGSVRTAVNWLDVEELIASVGVGGWGRDSTNWNVEGSE